MILGFHPNVLAQTARAEDPFLREARTMLERWQSRVPQRFNPTEFDRQGLKVIRNVWGEPVLNHNRVGPDLFNPVNQQPRTFDPVAARLLAAGRRADDPYFPSSEPPKALSFKGVQLELTPQERDLYQVTAGPMLKTVLTPLVMGPIWDNIDNNTRVQMVRKAAERVRSFAKNRVLASESFLRRMREPQAPTSR
jgi:hypothetical protein